MYPNIKILHETLNYVIGIPFAQNLITNSNDLKVTLINNPDWIDIENNEGSNIYYIQGFPLKNVKEKYDFIVRAENDDGLYELKLSINLIKNPKYKIHLLGDDIYNLYGSNLMTIKQELNKSNLEEVTREFIKDFTYQYENEMLALESHFIYWVPIFKIYT